MHESCMSHIRPVKPSRQPQRPSMQQPATQLRDALKEKRSGLVHEPLPSDNALCSWNSTVTVPTIIALPRACTSMMLTLTISETTAELPASTSGRVELVISADSAPVAISAATST
eukprot:6193466-Prymnesium_polylepis.1